MVLLYIYSGFWMQLFKTPQVAMVFSDAGSHHVQMPEILLIKRGPNLWVFVNAWAASPVCEACQLNNWRPLNSLNHRVSMKI